MRNATTILIVEDDERIRGLMRTVLSSGGYATLETGNAATALSMLASHSPDLMLLDLGLPDRDGQEFLREIRSWSNVPVVVVSARGQERDKVRALDGGADDYITKPFNILELKARIRALIRRSSMAPAAPAEPDSGKLVRGHIEIDPERRSAHRFGQNVELTLKEFDLIELLMRNPGKVYSREQLLDLVWGYDYQGDIRTVDVHIRRLREKLERNPAAPEYIITKWGVGYYFAEA